jgi:intracellular sulfur oxidation DsrE/DsrF family protein
MDRRNLFMGFAAGVGAMLASTTRSSTAQAASSETSKVVYHLADLDKVNFVLGNIKNHYEGVGGPAHVKIALVVHGPALKAFQTEAANPILKKDVSQVQGEGLELNACGNTMKAQKITLNDLLPGFIAAEQGGVVRIAELQAQGYLYLRP